MPDRRDTWKQIPEVPCDYTLLVGCIGMDCGSSEETVMPPDSGSRRRLGKAFWRMWPLN